jgi:hypothetical protein
MAVDATQSMQDLRKHQTALDKLSNDYIENLVMHTANTRDAVGEDPESEAFFEQQVTALCTLQTKAQATRDALAKVCIVCVAGSGPFTIQLAPSMPWALGT